MLLVMNEEMWLDSTDPLPLIDYCVGEIFRRKLRLLAVAFARPLIGLVGQRFPRIDFGRLLNDAEDFADGTIERSQFLEAVVPIRRALPPSPACNRRSLAREVFAGCPWGLSDVFLMVTYEAVEVRWAAPVGTLEVISRESLPPPETVEQMTAALCRLARDVFGNPFRRAAFSTSWRTDTALALAHGMYESREIGRAHV